MKTLIILDWDDTLFPTSWILKKKIDITNESIQNKYIVFFSKLDLLLHKFIFNMSKYGKVVIVTNAMNKWVNITANILPNTNILIQKSVKVISAKDIYKEKYPNNVAVWKKLIFNRLFKEYYKGGSSENIISIGDADYEYNALISLAKEVNTGYLKSVKLISKPTFDKLIDQIQLITESVKYIIKKKENLDLSFENL